MIPSSWGLSLRRWMVGRGGVEPPTFTLSLWHSTNWATYPLNKKLRCIWVDPTGSNFYSLDRQSYGRRCWVQVEPEPQHGLWMVSSADSCRCPPNTLLQIHFGVLDRIRTCDHRLRVCYSNHWATRTQNTLYENPLAEGWELRTVSARDDVALMAEGIAMARNTSTQPTPPQRTFCKDHITVFNIIRTKNYFRIRIAYSIYFNSTVFYFTLSKNRIASHSQMFKIKCNERDTRSSEYYYSPARQCSALILGIWGDVQHSLQELRPISTPWLNTLLCFHLVPINLIISQGT